MMHRKLAIFAAALPLLALAACESVTAPYDGSPQFQGTGVALHEVNTVTPSTNDANADKGWAHVLYVSNDIGQVTLDFISTRSFASCFEYRVDDVAPAGTANYNADITDGLWAFYCVNNSTRTETISAQQYVDIRMVFGAERDERFDWTRFYVPTTEYSKETCKSSWQSMGFRNQGQCVRYVETGKDSRSGQ
jgi:hypothetical protein